MAKISAYGATEIGRLHGISRGSDYGATLVLASDGRVLRRFDGERGYSVLCRINDPAKWTLAMLATVARRFGYEPEGGTQ